jgi:hypothetical protein
VCDLDNTTLYHVELKEGVKTGLKKQKIQTFYNPTQLQIPSGKKKMETIVVDCDSMKPYLYNDVELEQLFQKYSYRIDTTDIKQIITSSDADSPPTVVRFTSIDSIKLCNRFRKPFKIELKLMGGIRNFDKGTTSFPGYNGGVTYEKELLGFGPGGTNIVMGAEAVLSQRFFKIKNRHAFNLGLMSGFWPVDGGLFMPLAIHPRISFNEITSPLWGRCNSLNLFGDLGTAFDLSNSVPFITPKGFSSWFADAGIGFDLWQSRNHDLSFDLGYRLTNLALPNNKDYQQCLDEAGIEQEIGYPVRRASQVFVRVGFTW